MNIPKLATYWLLLKPQVFCFNRTWKKTRDKKSVHGISKVEALRFCFGCHLIFWIINIVVSEIKLLELKELSTKLLKNVYPDFLYYTLLLFTIIEK